MLINSIVSILLPTIFTVTCEAATYGNYGLSMWGQWGKIYYGYSGGGNLNTAQYSQALGHKPAFKNEYFSIGSNGFDDVNGVNNFVNGLRADSPNSIAMLTLEPWGGLESLTPETYGNIAHQCMQLNQAGSKIIIRFAHEMNGWWYPWGGQPANYISAFRKLSGSIRWWQANTGTYYQTMMMWAPSIAWNGIQYNYQSYYPGDADVDWVGLSLYHFDDTWSSYNGEVSDNLAYGGGVDFYNVFANQHGKPMMIAETSAPTYIGMPAWQEQERKQAWFSQLYSTNFAAKYPMLRAICWFEYQKDGYEYGVLRTWQVANAFKNQLNSASSVMVYAW